MTPAFTELDCQYSFQKSDNQRIYRLFYVAINELNIQSPGAFIAIM